MYIKLMWYCYNNTTFGVCQPLFRHFPVLGNHPCRRSGAPGPGSPRANPPKKAPGGGLPSGADNSVWQWVPVPIYRAGLRGVSFGGDERQIQPRGEGTKKQKTRKASCLAGFPGASSRTRTDGLRITNALLYQLSHTSS